MTDQIGNTISIVTDSVRFLGKELNTQKQSIDFHANILNQFVENGYEVYNEVVELENWWEKEETVFHAKIFFQRDYSSRPQLFFGVNKIENLTIKEKIETSEKRKVLISVSLDVVMTSYFSVKIKVVSDNLISPDDSMKNHIPKLGISYVLLNRRD